MATAAVDFYELLQISPRADLDTIRRVYRFLAAHLHPDNQEFGNVENFQLLKAAYDVLSNPKRRAEYDASRAQATPQPLSSTVDFMDNLEGELNRRLAVLAVLYYRRRTNPHLPEVSLAELEERLGFPRDYLDFTLWYLHKKAYINRADNAQFTLTADGVDFVETQRTAMPTLNKLLTSGATTYVSESQREHMFDRDYLEDDSESEEDKPIPALTPIAVHASIEDVADQRLGKTERRKDLPDHRIIKVERRASERQRRGNLDGRRKLNQSATTGL